MCDDFVLFVGHKFICDMKADATSRRDQSASGFKYSVGPTMVNYAVLNSRKQVRKSSSLQSRQVIPPTQRPPAESPKRKTAEPEVTTPSKRAKVSSAEPLQHMTLNATLPKTSKPLAKTERLHFPISKNCGSSGNSPRLDAYAIAR